MIERGKNRWMDERGGERRGSNAMVAAEEVILSHAWRDKVVTLIKKWEGRLVRLTADSF